MEFVTNYTNCRVCGSEALRPVVSLGNQRVVGFPKVPSDTLVAPLNLVFCENCHLVQLSHSVDADKLFREFWYRSGVSESMKDSLYDIVMKSSHNLRAGDAICDIGANDCTMLGMYPKETIKVGFDPSQQIMTLEASNHADYRVQNYFNSSQALEIVRKIGKRFKLITAIAMFYDLNDPVDFLQQVKEVLDGTLIIQMNYLKSMLENTAFDNICHEHVTYFSLTTLRWMLLRIGMEVVDVEENPTNGGSFRVYIKRQPISRADVTTGAMERIKKMLNDEKEFGLDKLETYHAFGKRIQKVASELEEYIIPLVASKQLVYAYGASTRGTVLLQTMKLPLAGVAERDENKFNRYMTSGWLKIHPEVYVRDRCKHMLVLPWHFEEQIIHRELDWLHKGGELIFPLPQPHVMRMNDTDIEKKYIAELLKEKNNATMASTNAKS